MKQITKMSRLTGELEKTFNLLNRDLFNGEMPTPIITVIPTPRAYAHYVPYDIWSSGENGKREINIASGTLDRPIENIIASLVHEMVHMYNDCVLKVQDTSNNGVYHNKIFKKTAEEHGLIISKHEKYGWTITEPADSLLEWILEHDEIREIEICRNGGIPLIGGTGSRPKTPNKGPSTTTGTAKSHHRKYVCPSCGCSVRATKEVHIKCMDCDCEMLEV